MREQRKGGKELYFVYNCVNARFKGQISIKRLDMDYFLDWI